MHFYRPDVVYNDWNGKFIRIKGNEHDSHYTVQSFHPVPETIFKLNSKSIFALDILNC